MKHASALKSGEQDQSQLSVQTNEMEQVREGQLNITWCWNIGTVEGGTNIRCQNKFKTQTNKNHNLGSNIKEASVKDQLAREVGCTNEFAGQDARIG